MTFAITIAERQRFPYPSKKRWFLLSLAAGIRVGTGLVPVRSLVIAEGYDDIFALWQKGLKFSDKA
jgi:hypothetical protein